MEAGDKRGLPPPEDVGGGESGGGGGFPDMTRWREMLFALLDIENDNSSFSPYVKVSKLKSKKNKLFI